jgi:hypothetical protein
MSPTSPILAVEWGNKNGFLYFTSILIENIVHSPLLGFSSFSSHLVLRLAALNISFV